MRPMRREGVALLGPDPAFAAAAIKTRVRYSTTVTTTVLYSLGILLQVDDLSLSRSSLVYRQPI
jgi:hypothetical protein